LSTIAYASEAVQNRLSPGNAHVWRQLEQNAKAAAIREAIAGCASN
jgi:hypothetical protein